MWNVDVNAQMVSSDCMIVFLKKVKILRGDPRSPAPKFWLHQAQIAKEVRSSQLHVDVDAQ